MSADSRAVRGSAGASPSHLDCTADKPRYECDGCGACCRTFPIYVMEEDADREPRIHQEARRNTNSSRYTLTLFPLPFHEGCCFLRSDQQCDIYSTRPTICRELAAGSEQCQEARQRSGLAPLVAQSNTI